MNMSSAILIADHPERHRYEAELDGQLAGYVEYNLLANGILFSHTEVLPAFEGRGVGSALARHVLEAARTQGQNVIPVCQFIAGYIRKHRDAYAALVQPHVQRAFNI